MEKGSLKGIEAVLFDFEGTLVDFQWNLKEAVREVLEVLKKSGFPIDRLQNKKYSLLLNEAMKIAGEMGRSPDEVREKIGSIYDRYDEDALTRWKLRPHAKKLLHTLKDRGVKTGLVSNVGRKAVVGAFLKLDIEGLLDVVVTRNDVRILKPDSEGIDLALNQLHASKEKTLFVGDSLDDVDAAKKGGLKVVIILGGENPKADLLLASPDFLIQSFDELIASLREE